MESLQFVGCSWFIGLIGLGFGFTQNKSTSTQVRCIRSGPKTTGMRTIGFCGSMDSTIPYMDSKSSMISRASITTFRFPMWTDIMDTKKAGIEISTQISAQPLATRINCGEFIVDRQKVAVVGSQFAPLKPA